MKRSEMVNLISSIVLNHDTNFKLNTEESDFLLKKLEDVGVKPPCTMGLRQSSFWDPETESEIKLWEAFEIEGWESENG